MNQGGNQGDDSAGQHDGAAERIVHMQIIFGGTERGRGRPDGGTGEGEMRKEMREKEKDQRQTKCADENVRATANYIESELCKAGMIHCFERKIIQIFNVCLEGKHVMEKTRSSANMGHG